MNWKTLEQAKKLREEIDELDKAIEKLKSFNLADLQLVKVTREWGNTYYSPVPIQPQVKESILGTEMATLKLKRLELQREFDAL